MLQLQIKVGVGKVALIRVLAHEKIFQTSGQNCEMIILNNSYVLQISLKNAKNN